MPDSKTISYDITLVLGSFTGGGTERVAVNMINYWVDHGRSVNVITRNGPEKDFYTLPSQVHRTILGDKGDSPNRLIGLFRNLGRVLALRKAIKREGAPVILSMLARTNILTVIACAGLQNRVVISERNDPSRQDQRWPWNWLRQMVYRMADVVTANSHSAVDALKQYVPDSKLVFLPNPVEVPRARANPEASTLILAVGRLVPQKKHGLLFEAVSAIEEDLPDAWTVSVLGEGAERPTLEKRISELGIENRVTLHGQVENPENFYQKAALFVLPSEFEGTPNVLLEAMAHGLPCIVSDSLEGVHELISDEKTGYWFKSGDTADLTMKLKRLVDDSELRSRIGLQARLRVGDFSPEVVGAVWDRALNLPDK